MSKGSTDRNHPAPIEPAYDPAGIRETGFAYGMAKQCWMLPMHSMGFGWMRLILLGGWVRAGAWARNIKARRVHAANLGLAGLECGLMLDDGTVLLVMGVLGYAACLSWRRSGSTG